MNNAQEPMQLGEQISSTITNDLQNTIIDAIVVMNTFIAEDISTPTVPQANAVMIIQADTIQDLTKIIQDLQQQAKTLSSPMEPHNPQSHYINPKTSRLWHRYCHTHNCCNHWGRACKNKAPDHKDKTTFCNYMGGSNKNPLPV